MTSVFIITTENVSVYTTASDDVMKINESNIVFYGNGSYRDDRGLFVQCYI